MSEGAVLDVRVVDLDGYKLAQFALAVGGKTFPASMSLEGTGLLEVHLAPPHSLYLAMPVTTPPSPLEYRGPAGANVAELLEATFGGPLGLADYVKAGGQLRAVGRLLVDGFQLAIPPGLRQPARHAATPA